MSLQKSLSCKPPHVSLWSTTGELLQASKAKDMAHLALYRECWESITLEDGELGLALQFRVCVYIRDTPKNLEKLGGREK